HVVVAPDPFLLGIPGVDAPAANAAHEGRAVAAPEARLALEGLARLRAGAALPGSAPLLLAREEDLGALADELARAIAEHLLEMTVAAQDHAVAQEGDADGRVVEDQLLLGERALHALLGLVFLGDVLPQPHRTLRGVAGLHCAAGNRAPDAGAVLAQVRALE